ncbi:MAG TPA: hypothetical protein VLE74_04205, partial [Candidatus Saccharimonadales bacterium]|nr:hypothetical protein [Candidatus Saccharimonadales bacterium]
MSETSPGNTKKPKFSRARQLAKLVLAGPENKIHDNLLSGATYDEASAEIGKLRDVFRADQGPVGTIARKLDSLTAIRQQNLPEGVQMKPVTEFHTGGKALAIKGHVQVLTSALAPNVKYGAIL